jgi:hypothetical protein
VTEAMVNIRASLDKAVADGMLDGWLVAQLTSIGKALFYKERHWDPILRLATEVGLPPAPLSDLAAWLPIGQVDQKRVDALEMMDALRAHLATGVTPLRIFYRFQDTGYHKAVAQRFMAEN